MHNIVKDTYSWRMVAQRTEFVYDFAMDQPDIDAYQRLKHSYSWGASAGFYAVFITILEFLIMYLI
jgi:hypothetical protein